MIQSLANTYKKHVALLLLLVFYGQLLAPLYAAVHSNIPVRIPLNGLHRNNALANIQHAFNDWRFAGIGNAISTAVSMPSKKKTVSALAPKKLFMGGPSSPEATSFKAVGSSNLVNLFTGDFSYSIPLLDVGGYPVNLFYNGGITMEQEASWVGLGWNINPGSVSRNMRGVPDDFDGTDTLTQTQDVKPNRTWGGELGVDGELMGIKEPNIGLSVGFSYNNYLGPALETGATVSVSLPIMESIKAEKFAAPSVGLSLGAKLSSRSGLTFSPSLSASLTPEDFAVRSGVGLSTSYNSRSGISSLNLHGEQSMYTEQAKSPANFKFSSTISFAKPSYMPTMRMPMQNSYTSGQIELGLGGYGIRGSVTLDGYYSESKVPSESHVVKKPLVGFMYSEKANNNPNAVMDLNRVNDAEVTPNTPIISAPMYTYDIFSIQGEGTGGSIRAYRGDLGFMRDNVTVSKDANLALGIDLAPPGHYGINVNSVSAPTRVGGWENNNNTLRQAMLFQQPQAGTDFENMYFRNPGEVTVTSEDMLNRIGHDSLARFQLSGSNANPRIETNLQLFGKTGNVQSVHPMAGNTLLKNREKRTQITTMLSADDATKIGLEKVIRNYRTGTALFDPADNHMVCDTILRNAAYRKGHHISEIDVLEQNGMRYIYGIPVYSVKQKDFTFSVDQLPDPANNLVTFDSLNNPVPGNSFMKNSSRYEGYLEAKETPAYASSFLITGLLSPDYVDVTGNGITEDDLGGAVKFNYTMSDGLHKWRTPRSTVSIPAQAAHFNEGKRSEIKDNKATISYGEREAWYLNSIESKSMVAIFKTDTRNDAKGVLTQFNSNINGNENVNKKLSRIDLYTKADIKAHGINNAKPVKSVLFEYTYDLCRGTPDYAGQPGDQATGKLTLKAISFSYNGQPRSNKERYVFNYGDVAYQKENPNYKYNAADRWGTYKPVKDSTGGYINPARLDNIDYPYTIDDKDTSARYAGAWSLKKILLPSGGQMEIQYEADDYGYVQDRRACNMFPIYGLGSSPVATTSNSMYNKGLSTDNLYVYVKLKTPLVNTDPVKRKAEIFAKYLATLNQIAFKLQVMMPKGPEPLTVYATDFNDYGLCSNSSNNDLIYIKLGALDGRSPLAKSAVGFIIENLTGQAFDGYDEAGVSSLGDFLNMVPVMLKNITRAFTNAENSVRADGKAKNIVLGKSFVRLDNPTLTKYGGGSRVKRVLVRDNWDKMTHQYVSTYGQDYDYTTTQNINGQNMTVSSGVASYEPAVGSEENPFREILGFSNKLPLASAQYGAIEMPMLEALYPSPVVGYSKVTVRSIHRNGTHGDSTVRSAIGKQVTEFYTAKDYPSYASYTDMASMDYKKDPFFSFFNKEVINRRIVSQGFLVQTNDMHGKMKYQAAYSERDEKTPVSASYHTYKNTGSNGLNDKVDFVYNEESGAVHKGNMGVDMELMTDVREFSIESRGVDYMGQIDLFYVPFPLPLPTIFRSRAYIENKYRAVTCTKLINYHAIEDSVTVMDKGSIVSTRTLAYDAETGSPIVTQTANEFNDSIYNISYPAYWAYSGVAPAYKNIGLAYNNVTFTDGRITAGVTDLSKFESGDELYITAPGTALSCPSYVNTANKLWVYDKNKNTTALTVPVKDLVFMDSLGVPFTKSGVGFRIVRSGHRNNLGLTVNGATAMKNPLQTVGAVRKLVVDATDNIVAASGITFKEKWQTDNDVIVKRLYYTPACSATEQDSIDCSGILEKKINPYLKGLVGNLKPYRSYTYYGSRIDSVPGIPTAIRKNGYIANYTNFWGFNNANNLIPDTLNPRWVWNSELTMVNGKGQELETRDALNRYTAAQYGYNKNLPVAMTQNARYGESFADNFEDYFFQETLNKGAAYACSRNYIDLGGQFGTAIIPGNASVRAHSGSSLLSINANTQFSKTFLVAQSSSTNYNFIFANDTAKTLITTGGNSTFNSTGATFQDTPPLTSVFSPSAIAYAVRPFASQSHLYTINGYSYMQISTAGTYSFSIGMGKAYTNQAQNNFYLNYFEVQLIDLNGNYMNATHLQMNSINANNLSLLYTVDLCPGIYKIQTVANEQYSQGVNPSGTSNSYNWQCFNCGSPDYKNLSTQNGCISTKPIAASDSMINPSFKLMPGKQMHASVWVREQCDSTVCYKTTYVNNSVQLQFPGSSSPAITAMPSGNIIDGWQKIEFDFSVPLDATSANLVFVNNGSGFLYVDDIRIHPFNANMKSYVYDPRTLRLAAELDENNYASFYEYDEEGQLIRAKKETIQGIKTIKETRSAKQQLITDVQ